MLLCCPTSRSRRRERAWYFFRIGATYPTPFPGSQFPVDAFDARL
jgi:hypothetical protein